MELTVVLVQKTLDRYVIVCYYLISNVIVTLGGGLLAIVILWGHTLSNVGGKGVN